jgi:hypothetical protein
MRPVELMPVPADDCNESSVFLWRGLAPHWPALDHAAIHVAARLVNGARSIASMLVMRATDDRRRR